eukprot:1196401-Prorocentrum_minimum.AAC.6
MRGVLQASRVADDCARVEVQGGACGGEQLGHQARREGLPAANPLVVLDAHKQVVLEGSRADVPRISGFAWCLPRPQGQRSRKQRSGGTNTWSVGFRASKGGF